MESSPLSIVAINLLFTLGMMQVNSASPSVKLLIKFLLIRYFVPTLTKLSSAFTLTLLTLITSSGKVMQYLLFSRVTVRLVALSLVPVSGFTEYANIDSRLIANPFTVPSEATREIIGSPFTPSKAVSAKEIIPFSKVYFKSPTTCNLSIFSSGNTTSAY